MHFPSFRRLRFHIARLDSQGISIQTSMDPAKVTILSVEPLNPLGIKLRFLLRTPVGIPVILFN